ncbi:MAG: hypothetical protein IIA67_12860, partial [Planctomycetes bacterium]|nr:hypothetical protein [Planctomycetota bacterium]
MTLSLRRKRRTTRPKPRTGDNAGSAWRRVVGAACLPAMLALLLAAPAPADEPAAPSLNTGAARKINFWKAKGSLRPRAASTLKDTSSNLKWRPYRKQKTVSGMARRPQTAISPKLPRLAPQRAVRLIAAGPTLDRFALQPRSGDTKPNERAFPPPSERPQTDVPSLPKPESASDPLGRPPIDLFPKDDPPKELPQPKELPDVAPKVEQLPFDIAPGKQPVAEPEAKASDQPLRKEDGPQGDAVEMKTDKYRLAKIGELSIDITPAPKSRTWNLRVDKEGNLIVYIPPNGLGAGGDEKDPSLDAVLVDIVDGQVTLREMLNACRLNQPLPLDVSREAFIRELGRHIYSMHSCGVWHRDLTGGNILVRLRAGPDRAKGRLEFTLLDVSRARFRLKLGMLPRLLDLARVRVPPEDRRAFVLAYTGGDPSADGP